MKPFILSFLLLLIASEARLFSQNNTSPTKAEIVTTIRLVNDYWQRSYPVPGWSFWEHAAYHTGNMEAYSVIGIKRYLDYSILWGELNEWKGAKSDNKENWKYHYGEGDDFVLFGDWQICFQTYIDIYNIKGEEQMIARAIEVMEYQMSTSNVDYWWWVDGLYMVMPVMTKLHKLTGNELYLEKLYTYFSYAKGIMYDEETGLFFRDVRYVYPQHTSVNGHKDFWSRGVGWVFAGLCKVLQDLPEDNPHRAEYVEIYQKMATSLLSAQQPGGYWTRSLLDPEHAPGYETSGTAFFTYGFFWGINNGLLDETTFLPAALEAWEYLSSIALQSDGKVGYIQPIGDRAIPGQVINANSTANFGVGAFLLACAEAFRWAGGEMPLIMESIDVIDENHLILKFTQILDPTTALDKSNYFLQDVVIQNVVMTDDNKGVIISCSDLSMGVHQMVVHNIESISGHKVGDGDAISFVYAGLITVTASSFEPGTDNRPERTIDFNFDTRWSAFGAGEWIQYDLGSIKTIESVEIAFFRGNERFAIFQISVSIDGENFDIVFDGQSSGTTTGLETYAFDPRSARYIRITGFGNSQSLWNSITEVRINFVVSTPTGSFDNVRSGFTIYPVPYSNGELFIKTGLKGSCCNLDIFDIAGRKVRSMQLELDGGEEVRLNNLSLPSGIYSLVVWNDLGRYGGVVVVR